MKKRITLVACFDKNSNEAIKKAIKSLNKNELCKVPFNIDNRLENDTLPYHITLSAWDVNKEDFVVEKLSNISFNKIETDFEFATIINSDNSKLLYLKPKKETDIRELQKQCYNILPTERYNPNTYILHSTINISKDSNLIEKQFKLLKDIELTLIIDKICLFEIYPATLVATKK